MGPIHHVKNMRDYTLFARCCPPAIALDFVHFYTQTGEYLGTSEISTHHSRNREKEKRIILGENSEMNTTMAHFAWFHSHLRIFYTVR